MKNFFKLLVLLFIFSATIVTNLLAQAVLTDSDGDGVTDAIDLDDDNDGILDADELYCG